MERINKHLLWLPNVSKCLSELSSAKWISSITNKIFDAIGIEEVGKVDIGFDETLSCEYDGLERNFYTDFAAISITDVKEVI